MFQDVSFLGSCPLAGEWRQTVEFFLVDHTILGGLKDVSGAIGMRGEAGEM
jgi:hypothetical protein